MKMKRKKPSFLKKGGAILGLLLMFLTVFLPTAVSAHDAYFLSVTMDPDGMQYVGYVTLDSNGNKTSKHAEFNKTNAHFLQKSDKTKLFQQIQDKEAGTGAPKFTVPLDASEGKMPDLYAGYFADSLGSKNETKYVLPFSFPGRHVGSAAADAADIRNADNADREQAMWVSTNLVGGLNNAINFVYSEANYNAYTLSNRQKLAEVGTTLANKAALLTTKTGGTKTQESFTLKNGASFVMYRLSNAADLPKSERQEGIDLEDYVRIKGPSGNHIDVPAVVQKGYAQGQRVHNAIKNTTYGTKKAKQDVYALSWQHIVMQGNYNSFARNVDFSSVDSLTDDNILTRSLIGVINIAVDGLSSILGLNKMADLMLNKGSVRATTWKGVMPVGLARVADVAFLIVMFLAWALMAGAFVKLLVQRNLSAINPRMRVELKEGLMDIVGAGFLLLMFVPIFQTLVSFNGILVDYFSSFSVNAGSFGTTSSATGTLAGAIVGIGYFVMDIYFNFIYIMRGLTVAVLYVFAPLFIVSTAFGGKFKQIFGNFMKELLGALFLQAIHSGILSFFQATVDEGVGGTTFYSFVVLLAFIPITNMFKGSILGLGGGAIDNVAKMGSGMAATAGLMTGAGAIKTMGATAAPIAEKINLKGNGTHSFNSGFSGGGGGDGGGGGGNFKMQPDGINGSSEGMNLTTPRGDVSPGRLEAEARGYSDGNADKFRKMGHQLQDAGKATTDAIMNPGQTLKNAGSGIVDGAKKHGAEIAATGAMAIGAGVAVGLGQGAMAVGKIGAALGDSGIDGAMNLEHSLQKKSMGFGRNDKNRGRMAGGFAASGGSGSTGSYPTQSQLAASIPDERFMSRFEPDESGHLVSAQDNMTGDIRSYHDAQGFDNFMGGHTDFIPPTADMPGGETVVDYNPEQFQTLQANTAFTQPNGEASNLADMMAEDFESGDINRIHPWQQEGISQVSKYQDETGADRFTVSYNNDSLGIRGGVRKGNTIAMQRDSRAEPKFNGIHKTSTLMSDPVFKQNFERRNAYMEQRKAAQG